MLGLQVTGDVSLPSTWAQILMSLAGITGFAEFIDFVLEPWRAEKLGDCLQQSVCPSTSHCAVAPFDCCWDKREWQDDLCVAALCVNWAQGLRIDQALFMVGCRRCLVFRHNFLCLLPETKVRSQL